ncbi:AMP-dependent synthetase/ligase [Nocardioides jiangxiensis]|uniref:Acyl-CoA synthetase n=1 Tax=Nocardioides jiangxiensis TaxID=3064524 RepID=A0ABT9B4W6_9ACTN|nr:AMP-dependent synthetase/ligase [Nocardioides sp. WY-20]MDO7869293.1 AMP-dependent synthetase/ligase [Nocardioides sp. WY-20]
MREFSTPPAPALPQAGDLGNLTDDVVVNATAHGETAVVVRRDGAGAWTEVSAAAFRAEVTATAKGLVATGVQPGDRVAILARTRWEWTVLDYAIWFAGGVSVPVYETSSVDQLTWILEDSGATVVLVEHAAHAERVAATGSTAQVLVIDDGALADLAAKGAGVTDADLEERRTQAGPGDLATLVYTSGTTGRPKGCMLTHGSLMSEITLATHELPDIFAEDAGTTLLFLPLAHVFARVVQLGCMRARVKIAHSSDIRGLATYLGELEPSFVFGVPRIFEKLFNAASQQAAADGKGRIFDRAVETAIAWSRAQDTHGRVPVRLRAQHALFARLVYGRIHERLGGRCTWAFSAGAPLGERLGHFYRGIGIPVLEAYGLTETSGALTVNSTSAQKVGSVGRPLPGTAVRVADDGELLFRGPQVFRGYWHNAEASSEVLEPASEGGWFHTGDVGEVDDEGFVRITGRKKELLVTAGGKNVAPAILENRLRSHPIVSQCMVVGDGEPFIGALVTIDADAFAQWAESTGRSGSIASLVDDPDLRAEVQRAVDATNSAVSQAEAIRKFTILPEDWTEEGGQLTPSLKLKRTVVMREFRRDVAALYGR